MDNMKISKLIQANQELRDLLLKKQIEEFKAMDDLKGLSMLDETQGRGFSFHAGRFSVLTELLSGLCLSHDEVENVDDLEGV